MKDTWKMMLVDLMWIFTKMDNLKITCNHQFLEIFSTDKRNGNFMCRYCEADISKEHYELYHALKKIVIERNDMRNESDSAGLHDAIDVAERLLNL